MGESAPQQPVDYLEQHSELVEDPAQAEYMAYGSRDSEEEIVQEQGKALDAASNLSNERYSDEEGRSASHAASYHAARALGARNEADVYAAHAAATYNQVKHL